MVVGFDEKGSCGTICFPHLFGGVKEKQTLFSQKNVVIKKR